MSIQAWAGYAGSLQARVWFQEDKYRLLELSSAEKMHFTGRKEGELEIWNWTDYPNSYWWATSGGDEEFVEALNA
jgi:hypothetical protein